MANLHFPLFSLPVGGHSRSALYKALDGCRQQLSLSLEQPVDPYRLAVQLGCDVAVHFFECQAVAGMLLQSAKEEPPFLAVALLNGARTSQSQRFTLAHEMVHFMLHPRIPQRICRDSAAAGSVPLEWEANEGAAELLLPYRRMLPFLASMAALPFPQKVQRISARFQVSLITARFRLEGLKGDWEDYMSGTALSALPLLSRRAREQRYELQKRPME